MSANSLILALLLFGVVPLASAYNVSFRDANTAVIEVGDPSPANPRQDGYFQIFGYAYLDTYAPGGAAFNFNVYLSDATYSNWLNCYIDSYNNPNAEAEILSLSSAVNSARGDSKIVITSDGNFGSCVVALEEAAGNVHTFPYPGFYADANMANFRVNMPVEFAIPDIGYFRYSDGLNSVVIFAPETRSFQVNVTTAEGGEFKCNLASDSRLRGFAVATFGAGGSPVAEYNADVDYPSTGNCRSIGFRIGL
jgi:hypothetical protein